MEIVRTKFPLLLLLAIMRTPDSFADELVIGSWNIANKGRQECFLISRIIKAENCDIVALQEVASSNTLRKIQDVLGRDWISVFSDDDTPGRKYFRAFCWKKYKLKCVTSQLARPSTGRAPFFAQFIWKSLRLNFLNVHFSGEGYKNSEKKQEDMKSVVDAFRRYEHSQPGPMVVLGDFNLLCKWINDPKQYPSISVPFSCYQDEPTTLKTSHTGYDKDLDHFCLNETTFKVLQPKFERVDAVKRYANGNYANYYYEASDHVMIKMIITGQ